MKPVIIDSEAEAELAAAVDFYEGRQLGLGLELEAAARLATQRIGADPGLHTLRPDGTRRMLLKRFPYAIHYVELEDAVWVLAFAHTSRKPGYWRHRL